MTTKFHIYLEKSVYHFCCVTSQTRLCFTLFKTKWIPW